MKLHIKTAEDLAAEAAAERRAASAAECERRIFAVADRNTQVNLANARAAAVMTPEQAVAHAALFAWIGDMRKAHGRIWRAGEDPTDDANWPACPPGVKALTRAF